MGTLETVVVWDLAKLLWHMPAQCKLVTACPQLWKGTSGSLELSSPHPPVIWSSKFDFWLPPPLEMHHGVPVTVWPFASLLCPGSPFGCSSLDAFCLIGTFVVPLYALKLIQPFFFLIRSIFLRLLIAIQISKRDVLNQSFQTSHVRLIFFFIFFLSNSLLPVDRSIKTCCLQLLAFLL